MLYVLSFIDAVLILVTLPGTKRMIKLKMEESDSINDVKEKIQASEGIPINQQLLMSSKMILQDDITLSEYDIQSGSTFNLVGLIFYNTKNLAINRCDVN